MKLRSYQQGAIDAAYKLWKQGARRVIVTAATGCHAKGQPLMMADRSIKLVEDIEVGDLLMGPTGLPRTVLSLCRGRQEMVRIVPTHGNPWDVNLDHVLTLALAKRMSTAAEIAREQTRWTDISVSEWIASGKSAAWLMRADRRTLADEDGPTYKIDSFTIQLLPEADYYGFELDGDSRYLLADGTVTHNTGKSVIFKKIAHDAASRSRRVLLLVEGQDLVEQAANHMRTAGLRVSVEMADQRVDTRAHDLIGVGPEVVVASIDSMVRRVKSYPVDFFGLIIYDECHHAHCRSAKVIMGHFGLPVARDDADGGGRYEDVGGCLLLGLTATPDRTDKKKLVPDIFEECAFEYPILQAVEDGWLVRPEQHMCDLPGYDLSKVRTVAGDLNASDLAEVLEPLVGPMVAKVLEIADGRRTLIYSVLKKLAFATSDAVRSASKDKVNIATIVGETDRISNALGDPTSADPEKRWPDRARMFEAFRRGELQMLSSVATLIEGVDLPEAAVAAVFRPTKSGLLYTQIAGRVFRPLPGLVDGLATADERRAAIKNSAKPVALMVDFAGNAGRHRLVRLRDILDDDLTDAQKSIADKLINSGEVVDVLDAIAKAREVIAEMEAARNGRGVTSTIVDPFDVLEIPHKRDQFDRPATEGQLNTLLRHGAVKGNQEKDRERMLEELRKKFDRTSASMYIDVVVKRTEARQSTVKQAMLLVGKGIPAAVAREMSYERASAAMNELAANSWKPTPGWIEKYKQPEVAA